MFLHKIGIKKFRYFGVDRVTNNLSLISLSFSPNWNWSEARFLEAYKKNKPDCVICNNWLTFRYLNEIFLKLSWHSKIPRIDFHLCIEILIE